MSGTGGRQPAPARVRVELPAVMPSTGVPVEGVALLTIDRPSVHNALDRQTMRQLSEHVERLEADSAVRCIVITGAGDRAFAAGVDIRELVDATPGELDAAGGFERWDRIGRLATPTIAAVRGFALGGGLELALACDLLVAAGDATFGFPEVRLGVIPGAGGTQRLTRAIGRARAMELILTGRHVRADDDAVAGLVSRLVDAGEVVDTALSIGAEIAALPVGAVRAAKSAVREAHERALADGIAFERETFFGLFGTHDQREGMRAFLEKRRPDWADG
jgi:enoyl-CoA hydratase